MAGNVYNITAEQGSTFILSFDIKTDGTAWNLTGYSARMQVRTSVSSSATLLNLVSPTDITLTSAGLVTVTVSATTMATVAAGKWVYDLELVSPTGIVEKPLKGSFIVQAEVTR
jgi:hypothetical protein